MSGIVKNTSRRKHRNVQSGGGLREDQLDEFINHIFIKLPTDKRLLKAKQLKEEYSLIESKYSELDDSDIAKIVKDSKINARISNFLRNKVMSTDTFPSEQDLKDQKFTQENI